MKFNFIVRFFVSKVSPVFFFALNSLIFNFDTITNSFFFSWKINNYADSYWFLYSNKKTIFEIRHIY